jgi:hypothetical protein
VLWTSPSGHRSQTLVVAKTSESATDDRVENDGRDQGCTGTAALSHG